MDFKVHPTLKKIFAFGLAPGIGYLARAGPTAAQYSALHSQLTHQGTLAALQQQQYHQASLQNPLAAGNPVAQNQAAVVAAAAAAVAAASQWPNSVTSSSQSVQQLSAATHLTSPNPIGSQTSPGLGSLDSQPQMAALAAAVAAQQQLAAAGWRWPTAQPAGPAANPVTNTVLASSPIVSTNSSAQAATSPTSTNAVISSANQQQSPLPPTLGPSAYLYSPAAGTGQEFMLIQQTNSPFTPNSTSDYSTDNSAHSSGFLESMEPIILDVFPSGFPLTQMKQGPVFSDNAFGHSVDALGGPLKSTSHLKGCGGIQNHSVCLPNQQNGNRVGSPTKASQPQTINVGKSVNGSNRAILENINNSNSSTRAM
nr:unnamed protein product [Spirometra erinaceieuropaei]